MWRIGQVDWESARAPNKGAGSCARHLVGPALLGVAINGFGVFSSAIRSCSVGDCGAKWVRLGGSVATVVCDASEGGSGASSAPRTYEDKVRAEHGSGLQCEEPWRVVLQER